MKTKEDLQKTRGVLTEAEISTLRDLIALLETFSKNLNLSLDGYRDLNNIYSIIRTFKESYTERIINTLKEGDRL